MLHLAPVASSPGTSRRARRVFRDALAVAGLLAVIGLTVGAARGLLGSGADQGTLAPAATPAAESTAPEPGSAPGATGESTGGASVPSVTAPAAAPAPAEIHRAVEVPAGAVSATVILLDPAGEVAGRAVLGAEPVRFDGLSAGLYTLIVQAELGASEADGVGISAAAAERLDPFPVGPDGSVVVTAA